MATSKKPSAAQLAARKKFSEIMKAGGFAKKRAAKKTVAKKRVAKKNPIVLISDTPKKAARKTVRKANPVKYANIARELKKDERIGYSVHRQSVPSWHAIAWFTTKKDAIEVAQEVADRTGVPMAVSRVQTRFGAL